MKRVLVRRRFSYSKINWDQNSGIVPTEFGAIPYGKPVAEFDVNAVPPRLANAYLAQQFSQLRRRGRDLVVHQEPMAQHIGLALCAELLQRLDVRWHPHLF